MEDSFQDDITLSDCLCGACYSHQTYINVTWVLGLMYLNLFWVKYHYSAIYLNLFELINIILQFV